MGWLQTAADGQLPPRERALGTSCRHVAYLGLRVQSGSASEHKLNLNLGPTLYETPTRVPGFASKQSIQRDGVQ
jgi:hypothetical protein